PPHEPAMISANEAEQAASSQDYKLKSQPHPAKSFPLGTPVKEAVSGSIEALAREAVAPALTAIEEKIADTASTLAAHTTQSETVLAAHTQQL
ncbi:hypothetical protein, partial [Staphylococcus aureus]|uniref:hypothetical protein n=1 Tax=Staphylococcus aureus TaxID=1280 RepID=UPI00301D4EBD